MSDNTPSEDQKDVEVKSDASIELEQLRREAKDLGIAHHPRAGIDVIKDRIQLFHAERQSKATVTPATPVPVSLETKAQRRVRLTAEANRLIRVVVAPMNPALSKNKGQVFTVENSMIGTIRVMVPFNNAEGWHIPKAIYNILIEAEHQIFVEEKMANGNMRQVSKLNPTFNVMVLPELNAKEIKELARKQAIARTID